MSSKRDLRGGLKELNGLQQLKCGEISCYKETILMIKKTQQIQLCSTFMDLSDDNNDLNDFLGIEIIHGLHCAAKIAYLVCASMGISLRHFC